MRSTLVVGRPDMLISRGDTDTTVSGDGQKVETADEIILLLLEEEKHGHLRKVASLGN